MSPSNQFSRRIWVRFTLLYTLIFAASMMLVLIVTLVIGKKHLTDQIRSHIQAEIQFLHYEFREDGMTELLEETEERIEKNPEDRRLQYVVQNARGDVLFDDFPAAEQASGWQTLQRQQNGKVVKYLFYYLSLDENHMLGVGSSMASVEQFQAAVGKAFLFTLLSALAIGIASGFAVGAWMSRRLQVVLRALRQVAKGKWQTRLAEDAGGGYEFEQLALELNSMFAHLERSITNLKYISAGISHDLRTPITRLRNRMAALLTVEFDRAALLLELEKAQQELDGLLSYFDAALLINELQSGELARDFVPLDFSALLEKMLENYGPILDDAGFEQVKNLREDVQVLGMASLLQRLIANLLDNVLIHGASGTLSVTLQVDDQEARLIFENPAKPDTPSPQNPSELPAAFQRKKMGQKIIEAIVTAHGGRCVVLRDAHQHRTEIFIPLARNPS